MRNLWLRSCLRIPIALLIFLAATSARPGLAAAAGPWSAIVIDAHTRGPVEGAVVVATWSHRGRGHSIGFGGPDPVGVEEVVTDAHGRFTLPARTFANPPLFLPIEGPDLLIFKSAYGGGGGCGQPPRSVYRSAPREHRRRLLAHAARQ